MKRRLLLTGPIGCGKSTLIRNALGPRILRAGGFVTERVMEGERLAGFELLPAGDGGRTESVPAGARRRFLTFGENGVVRDEGVFRDYASGLLRQAKSAPFAVLDELGGFELCVPEFFAALTELLQSTVPCVGVLKSPEAASALKRRVGVPPEWERVGDGLRRRILSDGDAALMETQGRYDGAAKAALEEWVREYVGDI